MKTFEEAFAMVTSPREFDPTKPLNLMSGVNPELFAKYTALFQEIAGREDVKKAMFIYSLMVMWGCDTPQNVLISAFLNGLVVGIEMEKQEL